MRIDPLAGIRDEIEARSRAIADAAPDWPCRQGCDGCCRNLACLPELHDAEWDSIEEGLSALPAAARTAVEAHLIDLADGAPPPYTCPFLDRQAGACRIYLHRPLACRTYGFYVHRGVGSYCTIIRERVERGVYSGVVWGNLETIDTRLDRLGPRTSMRDWIQRRCTMR